MNAHHEIAVARVKIDPEFQALIPALSPEERAGLEADIVRDGRATVPLVVWQGVLLDGHNRYDICQAHGLSFTTSTAPAWIKDRRDARIWIRTTALNRRSLGPVTRAKLVYGLEGDIAEKAKAAQEASRAKPGEKVGRKAPQNSAEPSKPRTKRETRTQAAALAGMSHPTYEAAKTVAEKGTPELQAAVDRGDIAVSTGADLTALPKAKQREIAAAGAGAAKTAAKEVRAAKHAEKDRRVKERLVEQAKAAPERARIQKRDAREFIDELENHSVDLLLTDPPYSTDVDDITRFAYWLRDATPKLKVTGRAYVCIGAYPLEMLTYLEVLRQAQWLNKSQILVWTYRNTLGPTPHDGYKQNWQAILCLRGLKAAPLDCPVMVEQFSVQDVNAPDGRLGDRYHAWQKPDALADRFVRHASKPGDLVVDPFAGTGTFLLAAARLGRKAIGCDNDDRTLGIAIERGCVRA